MKNLSSWLGTAISVLLLALIFQTRGYFTKNAKLVDIRIKLYSIDAKGAAVAQTARILNENRLLNEEAYYQFKSELLEIKRESDSLHNALDLEKDKSFYQYMF